MKTKIDRDLTTLAQLGAVKDDLKEFKARYTDNDLLTAFVDVTNIVNPYGGDILSCEVEAFPAGSDFDNRTAFGVELVVRHANEFCVVRFYCDLDLTIDTRDLMFHPGEKLYSCTSYFKAAR